MRRRGFSRSRERMGGGDQLLDRVVALVPVRLRRHRPPRVLGQQRDDRFHISALECGREPRDELRALGLIGGAALGRGLAACARRRPQWRRTRARRGARASRLTTIATPPTCEFVGGILPQAGSEPRERQIRVLNGGGSNCCVPPSLERYVDAARPGRWHDTDRDFSSGRAGMSIRRRPNQTAAGNDPKIRKLTISRAFLDGETRTRTGDTTIFSRYVLAAERREIPGNERFLQLALRR